MEWALWEAHDCEALGTLVASGVPGGSEGEWLVWAVSSAVPTCHDSCGEGGISFREAGFIFPGLEGVSSPLAVGTSGAMDVGFPGETTTGSCPDVWSFALEKSSSISVVMLEQGTISLGHSMTEHGDEIGIKNH